MTAVACIQYQAPGSDFSPRPYKPTIPPGRRIGIKLVWEGYSSDLFIGRPPLYGIQIASTTSLKAECVVQQKGINNTVPYSVIQCFQTSSHFYRQNVKILINIQAD